jgi:DNA-binding LacI/PurR family transcriptional regulator
MTTLHSVAQLANVTSTTVSNVIRGKGYVGEATRKRVLAAIEKLGYRPNLLTLHK